MNIAGNLRSEPRQIAPLLSGLVLSLLLTGCGSKPDARIDPDLARLIAAKRAQTREFAAVQSNSVPGDVWRFFDAMERGDRRRATNLFERMKAKYRPDYRSYEMPKSFWRSASSWLREVSGNRVLSQHPAALYNELWGPIRETLGAGEVFREWDGQLLHRFGRDIVDSIPTNSIYFGGTEAGRFVITAVSESQRDGRPFFTLTQNALADASYLDYLRRMYGASLYIPTADDVSKAFQDYTAEAQERLRSGAVQPGRVEGGSIAIMKINASLVKVIFDRNPTHEFYIEESYPLEWTYARLSPHGLILKLNREPLPELSEALTGEDHAYWRRYAGQLLGDWITDETSVKDVCDFAERVYSRRDLSGFRGSTAFAGNQAARQSFAKLRGAIGGLYAWRAQRATTPEVNARMRKEADFAFRQALALCPSSPEVVARYLDFLGQEHRVQDAALVAQAGQRAAPSDSRKAGAQP